MRPLIIHHLQREGLTVLKTKWVIGPFTGKVEVEGRRKERKRPIKESKKSIYKLIHTRFYLKYGGKYTIDIIDPIL